MYSEGPEKPFYDLVFVISLVTIFTLPFRNWIQIGQIGSIGRVIGLIFVTIWLIYFVIRSGEIIHHPFLLITYLLLVLFIINIIWSIRPSVSVIQTLRFSSIVIFITAIWNIYNSPRKRVLALQVLILGSYVALIGIFLRYFQGQHFENSLIRFNIPGYRPNRSGGIFATMLPICLFLIRKDYSSGKIRNWINYLYLPLGTIGILLTSSRGAAVAVFPTAILSVYYLSKIYSVKKCVVYVGTVTGLIAIPLRYIGVFSDERVGYLTSVPAEIISGDIGGRVRIWEASYSVLLDALFLGYGSGTHRYAVEPLLSQEWSAHNTFIAILVELGSVGGLITAFIMMYLIKASFQSEDTFEWITILAVFATLSLTFTWHLSIIWWLLFTILVRSEINPPFDHHTPKPDSYAVVNR